MVDNSYKTSPQTQVAIRTLIVAGYSIEGGDRRPQHIEILCKRTDILGASIPYLIAVTDVDEFSESEINRILRSALNQSRIPVIVTPELGEGTISWEDFTELLGGAVPSWQALSSEYDQALITAAKNQLPAGVSERKAWLIFEDLVASGLEFIFGRRVIRLGGRLSGRRVSDMLAQIPKGPILVVDTKAYANGFDVTWPELRPLVEYVKVQHDRQHGHVDLLGALISSSDFKQDDARLSELCLEFRAETGVPLSFIDADVLAATINLFREKPEVRNGIRWNQVFKGGRIRLGIIKKEMQAVNDGRVRKGV